MASSQVSSWNGSVQPVDNWLMPMDIPHFQYEDSFARNFNQNPHEAFHAIYEKNQRLTEPASAGPFFFYCPNLSPVALTKFIFSKKFPYEIDTFLFHFFSSIVHEYQKIYPPVYHCFSRIALPDDMPTLNRIIHAFSSVYATSNPGDNMDIQTVAKLVKAIILTAGMKTPDFKFQRNQFMELLKPVSMGVSQKGDLYAEINERPFPIFFTFIEFDTPPEYKKTGMLRKIGGLFKTKKDRCFEIKGFVLKYYSDNTMKQLVGELDIPGTVSSYNPATKKEPEHLLIKKKDGGSLGYKISKEGVRKKSNHSTYIAYSEKEEIISWANNLNIIDFWKSLLDSPPV